MPGSSLERRVEVLEKIVDELRTLPAAVSRLDVKVDDLRLQVAHVAERVAGLDNGLGRFEIEVKGSRMEFQQLRDETRAVFSDVRKEVKAGDEETQRQMRVLHEDVIARFALLDESRNGRRKR